MLLTGPGGGWGARLSRFLPPWPDLITPALKEPVIHQLIPEQTYSTWPCVVTLLEIYK